MVEPVRQRQTKEAGTDMFESKATAPHLDSTATAFVIAQSLPRSNHWDGLGFCGEGEAGDQLGTIMLGATEVALSGEVNRDRQGDLARWRIERSARTNSLQRTCVERGLTAAHGNLQATRADPAAAEDVKGNSRGRAAAAIIRIDEIGLDLFR